MTLQVDLEHFPQAVKRMIGRQEAYVARVGKETVLTASQPDRSLLIEARTSKPLAEIQTWLESQGLQQFPGIWTQSTEPQLRWEDEVYLAAVAYRSGETVPGVWVNAYPSLPSAPQALRDLYDEFGEQGHLHEVSYEEFMQLAQPNVIVVTPSELQSYLQNGDKESSSLDND